MVSTQERNHNKKSLAHCLQVLHIAVARRVPQLNGKGHLKVPAGADPSKERLNLVIVLRVSGLDKMRKSKSEQEETPSM